MDHVYKGGVPGIQTHVAAGPLEVRLDGIQPCPRGTVTEKKKLIGQRYFDSFMVIKYVEW